MEGDGEPWKVDGVAYVPHYAVLVANGIIAGASRLYQRTVDLGINEARIVAVLGHLPDQTQSRLSDLLAMNKSIVSRSVQSLVRSGNATAQGTPRTMRFRLTELGQRHHDIIIRLSVRHHRRLMAGLAEAEQQQLVSLLRRVLGNLPHANALDPHAE